MGFIINTQEKKLFKFSHGPNYLTGQRDAVVTILDFISIDFGMPNQSESRHDVTILDILKQILKRQVLYQHCMQH